MFQSSRIASGSWRLQASMACSPSSASSILKSRPSRILRATFRITLESSTTKQVFIVVPLCLLAGAVPQIIPNVNFSRRDRLDVDVENTIDIDHYQQLSFQPVYAGRHAGQPRVEIDRVRFAGAVVKLEDFANAVDQQAVGFSARFHADRHGRTVVNALFEPKPAAHVDQRDDAAAHIQHPGDFRRRQRHPGQPFRREHVLHAKNRQAEQLTANHGGDVFLQIVVVSCGAHGLPLRRTTAVGLLLERRDQSLPVEFGDIVVKAKPAAAFDGGGGHHRRQSDDRKFGGPRVAAHRLGEFEAIHLGHLDVGDGHVENAASVEHRQRLLGGAGRGHRVTSRLQHRHKHVAEERGIVDQQNRAGFGAGRLILAAEPVLEGERQEVPDIDDFGRLALDDGGAEHAGVFADDLDIEAVFDDVDNLVDHQRHRAVAIREHQQRLGALALYAYGRIHADQWHQLTAVLHHVAAVRQFDLAGIDFLKPGNQRQRHGLELGGAGAEHEQRCSLVGYSRTGWFDLFCDHLRGNRAAERLGGAVRIDDHDHRAIAENGIAGKHGDVTQLARHRLDHDFFGVEHAVDDDAESLAADLSNDDKSAFDVAGGFTAEQISQSRQRQQLVAQTQHRGILDAFDAVLTVAARTHKLDHRELGDGVAVATGFNDQRGDNCERERDLDGETQTDAGNRFHVNGAANLVDIVTHHIHADAAAGYAGDFGGGREPRRKYKFMDLRFRQLGDFGLGDEALRNRLGLDALGVEAAAIIGDLNDDVATFVIGRKPNAPRA